MSGLPGGGLGAIVGAAHRMERANSRVATAQSRVANLPTTATQAQTDTANRNLSAAQFGQKAATVQGTADVAHATQPDPNTTTNIGDPGWSPANSIGTGLYS